MKLSHLIAASILSSSFICTPRVYAQAVPKTQVSDGKGAAAGVTNGGLNVHVLNQSSGGGGTVNVGNWPSSLAVTGPLTDIQLRAMPVPVMGSVTAAVTGAVEVTNQPAPVPFVFDPSGFLKVAPQGTQAVSGTVSVSGSVTVANPTTSVSVSNLPATQPVSGSVSVSNFPATQPVSGSVSVSNFPSDAHGSIRTHVDSQSTLGDIIAMPRINQIEVNFSAGFDAALVTNSTASGGTAVATDGTATYSTGAGVNGSAIGTSVQTLMYRPGHDWYALFTAAFTTPTSAASHQRVGPFSTTDGFYIGYEGTSFGITHRRASANTVVPRASWNGDPLNGSVGSKFTSNGVPVALDPTKINIYRVQGSWFGAAPIYVEILSPDGEWVTAHTFRFPNSRVSPYSATTTFPVRVEVVKSGADATPLAITTPCWAMGTTDITSRINDVVTDYTLAQTTKAVIIGRSTQGGGNYVAVKVNPSGTLATGFASTGAPAAAVPAEANYVGLNVGGNLVGAVGMASAPTGTETGLVVRVAGGVNTAGKVVGSALATAVTVATSAVALPASALANRKSLCVYNNGSAQVFLGGSAVTTSSGLPLGAGASYCDDVGSSTLYAISAGSVNVRVLEH